MRRFWSLCLFFSLLLTLGFGCARDSSPEPVNSRDICYFIFTDRYLDASSENNMDVDKSDPRTRHGGDFQEIRNQLDEIQSLGATMIWLTPVQLNVPGGYHGYWIDDFMQIDPHLGSLAELKALVKEAHQRKIKVLLDVVANQSTTSSICHLSTITTCRAFISQETIWQKPS